MLQPASFALKFGFLAVLYLFLLWVAWSVLRDVRGHGDQVFHVRLLWARKVDHGPFGP